MQTMEIFDWSRIQGFSVYRQDLSLVYHQGKSFFNNGKKKYKSTDRQETLSPKRHVLNHYFLTYCGAR